jgi:hypothetical protein
MSSPWAIAAVEKHRLGSSRGRADADGWTKDGNSGWPDRNPRLHLVRPVHRDSRADEIMTTGDLDVDVESLLD